MGPETFPGRLAQARRRLAVQRWEDINDSRLAELLGTTTATVSRWMGGQLPSRQWLAKLEALLGISARYLEYGGDDLGYPPAPTAPVVKRTRGRLITEDEAARAAAEEEHPAKKRRA